MNQLIHFKGQSVRTSGTPDEPLFCAADVCKVLGIATPQRAYQRISARHKVVRSTHTLGGAQDMLFVTEPGLYKLIFMSRKPEAEVFQDLVFERVLPSLRKHGYFVSDRDDHPPELLALPLPARESIPLWIAIMQEIAAEKMPHKKIHEIVARYPNTRSFSVPSLYRRFNAWKDSNGDWKSQRPYRAP